MQLKAIQNKIKHTQLDVSMNLTKQPIFVPVWFLVALLGVVMSGFITIYKTQNVAVKEVAEQNENEEVNAVMVHNVKYYTYTIGTDSYSSREDFTPLFKRRIDKALKKEQEQIENVLIEVSQYFAVKDTFDIKQKVRKNIRKSLAFEVPQVMIDEYVPNLTKVDFQTSFNTEAMQTAKPKAVSGSLAQSFDEPLQEKTKQQKDDENRAQSFSNLGFVMNPTYAKRHKIKPSVVAVKTKILNDYLEEFGDVAIKEMHDYGIPASITLAQGLLESNAGDSRLAVDANNHFGIKCFSKSCKKGHCKNYTDDTHKDFFRVYKNVWESYRAHSLFLQRDRYKHLLKLKKTDYKGWAHGLKKAGYATDKRYAYKLINIIEALKLYEYDKK
jgi:flagellum-specific peptidoglycan hydrolase FlgJ